MEGILNQIAFMRSHCFTVLVASYICFLLCENVIPIYLFFENSAGTNLEVVECDLGFMDLVLAYLEWS